jgi:hypothetical protein
MFNSNSGAISSPFFINKERCIFCLSRFSDVSNFLIYDGSIFEINKTHYKLNCQCNPSCHKSCIATWIINKRCPVCSEEVDQIETPTCKEYYKKQMIKICYYLFLFFLFGSVVALGVMIYLYVKKGA